METVSNAAAADVVTGTNPMFESSAPYAAPGAEPVFTLELSEQHLGSARVLDVAVAPDLATDLNVETRAAADEFSAASAVAAQEGRAAGFAAALEGFGHDVADSDISISLGSSEEEHIDLESDVEDHIDLNLTSGEESIDLDEEL